MAISFQSVSGADFDALWTIEQSAHPYPWSAQLLESCLDSPYWGELAQEEEPLGFFLFQQVLDEVTLMNICVAPACQGKGHGRALLERALAQAKARGAVTCFLEVRCGNKAALGLYRKLGFVEDGRRKGYYPAGDGKEDAVLMSRVL